MNYEKLFRDPQVIINRMIKNINHPICGKIKLTGNPVKFSDCEAEIKLAPPTLGNYNFEIFSDFGSSIEEIEYFKKII